jgi:cobalamin biosynthesis Mg chelatase CobN
LGLFSFGLSVFALLALTIFPTLAQAETASEVQYKEAISSPYGGNKPVHKEPSAHSSTDGGNTSPTSKSPTSSEKGSSTESPYSKTEDTSGNGGTGQGNPGSGSNGGKAPPVKQSVQAQPAPQSASHGDSGGSSPLVPILIAIAALAAISIGAVMLRAKRQRASSGQPVSPEAS